MKYLILTFSFLAMSFCCSDVMQNDNNNFIHHPKKIEKMRDTVKYGVEGLQAPELIVEKWINGKGESTNPVQLKDMEGKFKVIYCFQAWCPGCHSRGLPTLKNMVEALKGNDKVEFLAIQTVFEGKHANTYERMVEIQKEYELEIPFGHDEGSAATGNHSSTMYNYRTGGTPWFILIDQKGRVIFNDFHLNEEKAIEYLQSL